MMVWEFMNAPGGKLVAPCLRTSFFLQLELLAAEKTLEYRIVNLINEGSDRMTVLKGARIGVQHSKPGMVA